MAGEAQADSRVTVCIPTGPPKAFAFGYLVAALRNLDYPNFDVLIAYTKRPDYPSDEERQRLFNHLHAEPNNFTFRVIDVHVTSEELAEPWTVIVKNRRALRNAFLDSDSSHMLMVGGDNPPARGAIRRLLKLNVDCALGVSYQRPGVDAANTASYPMIWRPIYTPEEAFRANPNLEPVNRVQIRKAFYRAPFLEPVYADPEWGKRPRIDGVTGGDGNCLYSRRVLKSIGWVKPNQYYASEDIQFLNTAMLLGFTTACDPGYHVPHLHTTGEAV